MFGGVRVRPRVKICCIGSVAEAERAVAAGADALGLVSAMPSGPGQIDEELIRAIARRVPPPIATFLLTSLQEADAIVAQHRRCGTNTIQLCDHVAPEAHQRLRAALPGIALVQVVHVRGPESIDEALAVAPHVDALLLDSGNQSLAVRELGGTGRIHDWSVSARIRDRIAVPVFLAGGLTAANVGQALAQVRPWGLDLCSGLRTDGLLDDRKVSAFLTACQAARPHPP